MALFGGAVVNTVESHLKVPCGWAYCKKLLCAQRFGGVQTTINLNHCLAFRASVRAVHHLGLRPAPVVTKSPDKGPASSDFRARSGCTPVARALQQCGQSVARRRAWLRSSDSPVRRKLPVIGELIIITKVEPEFFLGCSDAVLCQGKDWRN
jgi:hypothetical protein